ncbi:hypothetical protein ACMD2_21550 [Ananas comosus]|uniref:Uncharacterized protein n=1 Tax=Ananas comosus TaxID=4615 RepID=A0A199VMV5_ANACO|nr:hypothetical protein ACMD2_21550 [Ananas comosus]
MQFAARIVSTAARMIILFVIPTGNNALRISFSYVKSTAKATSNLQLSNFKRTQKPRQERCAHMYSNEQSCAAHGQICGKGSDGGGNEGSGRRRMRQSEG